MDADRKKIVVNIFGQSYTLLGEANPEYMLRLAKYVDSKMREVSDATPGLDQLKIAILAAINISNEIFQIKDATSHWEKIIKEKSENMINILDKTFER